MSYRYNAPACRNCGRNKTSVAPPGADLEGIEYLPYCHDCFDHRCGEYELSGQCRERQAREGDTYQGYCAKHLKQRTRCRNPYCHNEKEPWAKFCAACRDRHEATQGKALIRQWRAEGVLCPGCKSARQHAPQRYCAPCLKARGVEPLVIPKLWRRVVQGLVAGSVLDPAKVAKEEQARKRAAYLAKQKAATAKAKANKAKRKRAVNPLTIVNAVFKPTPEERAAAGLPKRKRAPYKPAPKRAPYWNERKYKPRFWTKIV